MSTNSTTTFLNQFLCDDSTNRISIEQHASLPVLITENKQLNETITKMKAQICHLQQKDNILSELLRQKQDAYDQIQATLHYTFNETKRNLNLKYKKKQQILNAKIQHQTVHMQQYNQQIIHITSDYDSEIEKHKKLIKCLQQQISRQDTKIKQIQYHNTDILKQLTALKDELHRKNAEIYSLETIIYNDNINVHQRLSIDRKISISSNTTRSRAVSIFSDANYGTKGDVNGALFITPYVQDNLFTNLRCSFVSDYDDSECTTDSILYTPQSHKYLSTSEHRRDDRSQTC